MGKVRINNQVVEGKSLGNFVDQQVKVRVVEVLRTQIIVKPIKQE
jgi:membrane-bound ClpP family serine protease